MGKYQLPAIDRDATRDAVEEAFDWYRLSKYLLDDEPSMTAQYPGTDADLIRGSGGIHSSTESLALKRATIAHDMERIERAVNRLTKLEKTIITRRLMKDEDEIESDQAIMDSLHIGRKKFYKVKGDSYYKIALYLGIAAYKPEEGAKGE